MVLVVVFSVIVFHNYFFLEVVLQPPRKNSYKIYYNRCSKFEDNKGSLQARSYECEL